MSTTVGQMTPAELKQLIESVVEGKLSEMFGDPDEGLPLKKAMLARLQRQKKAVRAGERGESMESLVERLGLE